MADKGDTYYCRWQREPDGTVTGWEIRRPTLRATASSPEELMQELGDVVGEHYDDHEAALHFDPPLFDAGDPTWFVDDFVEIAWDGGFGFRGSASTAYANGRCERCGGGLGQRTSTPLVVDWIVEASDGASSPQSNEPPPGGDMPGSLIVVSEAFLNALSEEERATFDARPVKWATPRRRRFFELVPRTLIPLGAVKGLEVTGWRCDRCDRRVYSHGAVLGWGVNVACRESLPANSPRFFFAGSDTDVKLYCTRERWKSLAGKKWSRKLTGSRLAVVDVSRLETRPVLGTLDEIEEHRRKFGFTVPLKQPQQR